MHLHRASRSALVGLAIHTFFDGVAIASGFLISAGLGTIVFLAILLHKIPEGFAISSLMLAGGGSRGSAFLGAVTLGASTVAGVLLMGVLHRAVAYTLPISAGVTLYVAASDLMPEVNREPGLIVGDTGVSRRGDGHRDAAARPHLGSRSTSCTAGPRVLAFPRPADSRNFLTLSGFDRVWRPWPGPTSN